MATSNRYNGNGLSYGNYYFIQWQLATQEVGNNRSLINWQCYAHFQGSDNQLDNGRADNQYGNLWYNGGRVKNFEGNYSTRDIGLASGSFWVGHDNAGNGSVSLSGGIDYYGSGRSNAGGSDSLPWIPRHSVINSAPNMNDTDNPTINYSNPANTYVDVYLETPALGGSGFAGRGLGTGGGGNYTWILTEAERDIIRSRMANVKTATIRFVVHDTLGGSNSWSFLDRTVTIVGGEPTFVDFDYRDKNSTTSTITGNNQVLIQGKSVLELTVDSTDKATANKSATMSKYNASIASINQDISYVTSTIVQELGVVGANSDTALVVKAIDSRTNFTQVSKTITILPYISPQLVATARRVNNFETATTFHIEGVISRLTLAGTDKNGIVTGTAVAYRVKKTTDASWGSWVNKTSSLSTGNVSLADFNVDLDRNYAWNVQVRLTDKLETTTVDILVPVGIPIFRIGLDGKVYNNEQPLMVSHVGQIIMSTTLTTASAVQAIYGGTWVAWGTGRTPVGIDTGQTEFNTVEKTGGHKLLQSHTHNLRSDARAKVFLYGGGAGGADGVQYTRDNAWTNSMWIENTGGGDSQNLQPYITTYMWKRTV